MKFWARFVVVLLGIAFLIGCVKEAHGREYYGQDMHEQIARYHAYSDRALKPYFKKAGIAFPPTKIALLIFKNTKRMELWAQDKSHHQWHHIKNFHVYAASGGPGPKLHSMDYQVPEGIYHIVDLNPDSHFLLSMELNYPNAFDRLHAGEDHRTNLGDNIFIHGNRKSIGCIAIGNRNIEQLFVLAHTVGEENIDVIIAPNDLRTHKPIYGREHPRWLPELYANIKSALQPFKYHHKKHVNKSKLAAKHHSRHHVSSKTKVKHVVAHKPTAIQHAISNIKKTAPKSSNQDDNASSLGTKYYDELLLG